MIYLLAIDCLRILVGIYLFIKDKTGVSPCYNSGVILTKSTRYLL